MKLDYGAQLSPCPIALSIGTLIKPKLLDIAKLSFDKFSYYEFLLKLSPDTFYTKLNSEVGTEYWNSLSDDERDSITLYDLILENETLQDLFVEIFNFFFEETVIFEEGVFIILRNPNTDLSNLGEADIKGIISKDSVMQVLDLIQQVCCINDEEKEDEKNLKFKNSLAEKLFKRMKKAAKEAEARKKSDVNYTIPNIISTVSNRHQSINPVNVWDLTIFQLIDAFRRLQANEIYEIDATRVSVWGDEKKSFDAALWYKNQYDNNSQPI